MPWLNMEGLECILNSHSLHIVHSSITNTNLPYCLVHSSEGRLLVVVVNPSVSMQYVDAILLGRRTVAAVDAMVWTIIPLARKLQQRLCNTNDSRKQISATKQEFCILMQNIWPMNSNFSVNFFKLGLTVYSPYQGCGGKLY